MSLSQSYDRLIKFISSGDSFSLSHAYIYIVHCYPSLYFVAIWTMVFNWCQQHAQKKSAAYDKFINVESFFSFFIFKHNTKTKLNSFVKYLKNPFVKNSNRAFCRVLQASKFLEFQGVFACFNISGHYFLLINSQW